MKKLFKKNETYILMVVILLSLLVEIRSGQFFTGNNIVDIVTSMIVPGMFCIGAFMVIVSGGIDVSFPAVASLSMYATTEILLATNYQGSVLLAFVISGFFGILLGACNGFLISKFKFPVLIVTLGTQSIFRGIMQGALGSREISNIPKGMNDFGESKLFTATNRVSGLSSDMPTAILIFIALIIITYFILKYTMIGRGIYAIGGDISSATRAGFSVKYIQLFIYSYVGLIAGVAGMLRACMMQNVHPTNLLGLELLVIAAVVLGGTKITGGAGTITGAILGIALLTIMSNSLLLLGIPTYWQRFFTGLLIIVGTGISAIQVRRSSKSIIKI